MERSFSQVLARGKYVHSIVFHEVKPDKVDEYTELVGNWYPKMASLPENKVHLVGSWRTEVGDCNTFGESFWTQATRVRHCAYALDNQYTFGSTRDTRATINHCTTFKAMRSLRTSMGS
jgi:hypothetical protein